MAASISRRAFIQWLPDEPTEPTSTIVLTSPECRFVDVRLIRAGLDHVALSSDQVDWAFAGISRSTWQDSNKKQHALSDSEIAQYHTFASSSVPEGTQEHATGKIQHTTWTHMIDSRFDAALDVRDEGDMLPLPSLGLTLEKGNMCNPTTGQPTDYVEGWTDDVVEPPGYAVLELTTEHDHRARGFFIRIGPWMQGVARIGDSFALQRWHHHADTWTLQADLGDLDFPVDAVSKRILSVGDVIKISGETQMKWTVVESGNA